MAYGSAKGRIFRGDIYAEDDPNQDTYIDWGNDFISFGVGGIKVLNVSASDTLVQVLGQISASSNITASGHVSASAYYGDGQYLKNVSGTPGGANTEIQFNDAGAFGGSSDLTWDSTNLVIGGGASASFMTLTGSSQIALSISSSSPSVGGSDYIFGGITFGSGTLGGDGFDGASIIHTSFGGEKSLAVEAKYGGLQLSSSLGVAIGPPAAGEYALSALGIISASSNITASGHVSASAFYGDGQHLTNLPTGALNTTTGGGNNTLFLPFVSSSTGASPAVLFTDSAVSLKPQSGSLILTGDGKVGVPDSVLGEFSATSSYASRLSFKGADIGTAAGTEPYIHAISSSYTVDPDTFGPGFPPTALRLDYETLEIRAPSGHADGGDVRITGSGNFHLDFSRPSGSTGWPFTRTFQSTMAFGSLETAVHLTTSLGGDIITSPWSIINGADDDGATYAAIDYDQGGWYFSSGSNPLVKTFGSDLSGSWTGNFKFDNPGSASFFGATNFYNGLEVHSVPLTSNVGAQIGGGAGNRLQVVVTSSFDNWARFNTGITAGGGQLTVDLTGIDSKSGDLAWLVRSGSLGTGSGPGKNGPLMFYMSGAGGTTDLLKFNTSGPRVGTVFPRTFYPANSNAVDMGTNDLAFRTVFATKIGSAGDFTVDGANASNSNFAIDMPNNVTEALMIRDTTAGSNWITLGTSTAAERVTISKPTYIGGSEAASPALTLDVHYTGSKSPQQLGPNTGGGEVVYFGTGSLTNVGALHYLNANGGWVPTNANATGSGLTGDGGHRQLLGISLGSDPQADGMLIRGFFNVSGAVEYYRGDFKIGSAVYVQAQTAPGQGRLSSSAPTGSGQFVRVVGYATDIPKVIYFNPDATYKVIP